jgi:hypothetical protein
MPTTIAQRGERGEDRAGRRRVFAVDRDGGAPTPSEPRDPFTRDVRIGKVFTAQHDQPRLVG